MHPRIALIALTLAAVVCGGCSRFHKKVPRAVPLKFPKVDAPGEAPRAIHKIGKVIMVNSEGRFVLIETGPVGAPGSGVALKSFRAGAETATLAVSGERRGSVITADIVTGSPANGDDVMR